MSVEFGYAAGVHDEWCVVNPADKTRMLCRRQRGWVPEQQPAGVPEGQVHDECLRRLDRRRATWVGKGICPACWGDVPVVRGKVQPHGEWVVGRRGMVQSTRPCGGAGAAPEAG